MGSLFNRTIRPSFQKAAAGSKSVFALTGVEWSTWRDAEYGGGGLSLTAARPASHKQRLVASKDWIYSPRQWFNRLGAGCRHAWTWLRAPSLEASMPLPTETTRTAATTGKKPKPVRRACVKQAQIVFTRACSGCKRCWGEKYKVGQCATYLDIETMQYAFPFFSIAT